MKVGQIDLAALKGSFRPGETAHFRITIQATVEARIRLVIWHLSQAIATIQQPVPLHSGRQQLTLSWQPPEEAPRGYGLAAELLDGDGRIIATTGGAFDVLAHWTDYPRYGFLSDFSPGRGDLESVIETLASYHINGLQFYDWQFRHDQLLSPEAEYVDPLGRKLSLDTVRHFIELAHLYGMAAMPYLAVYAASLEFWRAHPEWALYDEHGQPLAFMDFLGLMDPTAGRPWIAHLLDQCAQVLAALPFDGLHVDQYGDPKEAFDAAGAPVDIPASFAAFIEALRTAHRTKALTFNAVGNWPIEILAKTEQDFIYIEVWPPKIRYLDLVEIVLGARALSGGKPVVVALYLPADRPINIRLADALIFSCGGARIELGEGARLLSDPYFPKHQAISPELERILGRYYDFAVRYEELIGPFAAAEEGWQIQHPEGIWILVRRGSRGLTLCLANLCGIDEPNWDRDHGEPRLQEAPAITIADPPPFRAAYWASPDGEDLGFRPLGWELNATGSLRLAPPRLAIWGIVFLEE